MNFTLLSEKTFLRNAPVDLSVGISQNWVTCPCLNQSLSSGVRHHDWLTPIIIHPLRIKLPLAHGTEDPNRSLGLPSRRGLPVGYVNDSICSTLLSPNLISCPISWFQSSNIGITLSLWEFY